MRKHVRACTHVHVRTLCRMRYMPRPELCRTRGWEIPSLGPMGYIIPGAKSFIKVLSSRISESRSSTRRPDNQAANKMDFDTSQPVSEQSTSQAHRQELVAPNILPSMLKKRPRRDSEDVQEDSSTSRYNNKATKSRH